MLFSLDVVGGTYIHFSVPVNEASVELFLGILKFHENTLKRSFNKDLLPILICGIQHILHII